MTDGDVIYATTLVSQFDMWDPAEGFHEKIQADVREKAVEEIELRGRKADEYDLYGTWHDMVPAGFYGNAYVLAAKRRAVT
jgi:hypothetical protein